MFYSKTTNSFYDPAIHSNIPDDAVEITREEYDTLQANAAQGKFIIADKDGYPVNAAVYAPSKEETIAIYEMAAQQNLDSVAKSWGYNSMTTAVSYSTSTNPQYKADADALIAWRDSYWAKAYQVEAGTLPKTAAEFVALLPEAPTQPTSN